MKIRKIKADAQEVQINMISEAEKNQKVTPYWKGQLQKNIIPYQSLRESAM